MIDIFKLEKKYSSDFTLKIDELHIADGERVAVIGQNGSGKSTLLRILAGIIKPDSGDFTINAAKSDIGYQPQEPYCFAGSVTSNVKLGLSAGTELDSLLRDCGLYNLRSKRVSALSGGERQRLCLARMLAGKYRCLLLDEPLSAADIETADRLERLIVDYCDENSTTLLMSTHLPSRVSAVSTRVLILRNGSVAEYSDTNKALTCPSSEFGKKFMNQWRIG